MFKKSRRRVVRILANNKTLVTFLSAFIVFGSFTVKERWDENLKELSAAINTAEDRSVQFNTSVDFSNKLKAITDDIQILISFSIGGQRPNEGMGTPEILERFQAEALKSQEDRFFAEMTDLRTYLKVLPRRKYYDLETTKLAMKMNHYEKQKAEPGKEHDVAYQGSLRTELKALTDALSVLTDQAFTEGEDTLEWSEKWHRVSVWIVYTLFALGWGLSLVSNIAGVKTEARAD